MGLEYLDLFQDLSRQVQVRYDSMGTQKEPIRFQDGIVSGLNGTVHNAELFQPISIGPFAFLCAMSLSPASLIDFDQVRQHLRAGETMATICHITQIPISLI
jgi:hypothetical protein